MPAGRPRKQPAIDASSSFPDRFRVAQTSSRHWNRHPAGARVEPTGWTNCNAAASDVIRQMAIRQFGELSQCGILWGVDEVAQEVAGRLVAPDVTGANRPTMSGGSLSIRLAGVFKDYQTLRPDEKIWVPISFHPNATAPEYFILEFAKAEHRHADNDPGEEEVDPA